jgi:hypothetical protein
MKIVLLTEHPNLLNSSILCKKNVVARNFRKKIFNATFYLRCSQAGHKLVRVVVRTIPKKPSWSPQEATN